MTKDVSALLVPPLDASGWWQCRGTAHSLGSPRPRDHPLTSFLKQTV